jgi:methylenetetrahydrofolate reductase
MKIIDELIKYNNTENKMLLSLEYFPPVTSSSKRQFFSKIKSMRNICSFFVSISYGLGGRTNDITLEICRYIKEELNTNVQMHLTCYGADPKVILDTLRKLKKYGIKNILALRGDTPIYIRDEKGNTYDKSIFNNAIDLVKFIRKHFGDYFCISVAGYPEAHPKTNNYVLDLRYLKAKVDAGADFIITQLFYDTNIFFKFVADCRAMGIKCPIVPGILPIMSYSSFKKMINFCKINVPEDIMYRVEKLKNNDKDLERYGMSLASEMISKLYLGGVKMLHIFTLNRDKCCESILKNVFNNKTNKVNNDILYLSTESNKFVDTIQEEMDNEYIDNEDKSNEKKEYKIDYDEEEGNISGESSYGESLSDKKKNDGSIDPSSLYSDENDLFFLDSPKDSDNSSSLDEIIKDKESEDNNESVSNGGSNHSISSLDIKVDIIRKKKYVSQHTSSENNSDSLSKYNLSNSSSKNSGKLCVIEKSDQKINRENRLMNIIKENKSENRVNHGRKKINIQYNSLIGNTKMGWERLFTSRWSFKESIELLSNDEKKKMWGEKINNMSDIQELFIRYYMKKIKYLPWCDFICKDINIIQHKLIKFIRKGYFVINAQPPINGLSTQNDFSWSSDMGYIYQKEYLEFFCSRDKLLSILKCINKMNQKKRYIYCATNVSNKIITNARKCDVTISWSVLNEHNILKINTISYDKFLKWKDNSYKILRDWMELYDIKSTSYEVLNNMHENYYLVYIIDNDYVRAWLNSESIIDIF